MVKFSLPTLPRETDSGYYSPRKQYKSPFFSKCENTLQVNYSTSLPSEITTSPSMKNTFQVNYSTNLPSEITLNSGVYGYKFRTEFILNDTTYSSNAPYYHTTLCIPA